MKMAMRLLAPFSALVAGGTALLLLGGCGSSAPPPVPATVRGKVILNGHPVAGGLVVFTPHPERGGSGKSAFAETGADGSYALQLNRSSAIPPGWYRISLAPPPPASASTEAEPAPVFPTKLSRPDLSGLEREVQAGKEHVFEFVVDVPKE
ncbi:hypothetical protein J8F10_13170 [Gemmata sp. G18]|uniref:Carboxypeptidase regulatory-like domain-containing protein n=1 Tax=Gemmata palustris TaxID=2822762 RepID=A0ABS5BR75_9BACT|nr:hypothetical protein [Gemmata palustris]MBP3956234.1 hypothetical protein [Gemmata palustris]